jgi:nucleoside-diphosphate-sugar epimerase
LTPPRPDSFLPVIPSSVCGAEGGDDGVELLTGNLRDAEFCREAVGGCDAIVHLGAMLLFGPDDNPALFEDNLRGTFNMMEAATSASVRRFVFASSDEIYPAAVGEAFNLSGPAPFSYDEAAAVMAEATGRHVVDACIPGPPIRIHHSIEKARGMLGYAPRHDLRSTVAEALGTRHGRW